MAYSSLPLEGGGIFEENDGRSERAQTNLLFFGVSDAIVAQAPSAVTRSVLLHSPLGGRLKVVFCQKGKWILFFTIF